MFVPCCVYMWEIVCIHAMDLCGCSRLLFHVGRLSSCMCYRCSISRTHSMVLHREHILLLYIENTFYCSISRTLSIVLYREHILLFYIENTFYCYVTCGIEAPSCVCSVKCWRATIFNLVQENNLLFCVDRSVKCERGTICNLVEKQSAGISSV